MNLDLIRQLLDLVRTHELAEFELEHEGIRIRVRKDPAPVARAASTATVSAAAAPSHASTAAVPLEPPASDGNGEPVAAIAAPAEEPEEVELAMITSPIVGTFYRAPEPAAPNFTDVGQTVKRGEVLCIIEAMKLMNEIESEYDGEIVRVFVESGQPVQYGERLFAIRVR